ncbi:unnamed protein product [Meloidogyne enterolobii]|uniref:Uncharacterized protein n=2 Tax=Meloidogyne enterolobii TaxID=390850 RepID=A0A6V7Y9W2_MELEN|nr:unnamed protein product [Meloidogyne enterolobii]
MSETKLEIIVNYFWIFFGEIYQLWAALMFTHIFYILLKDWLVEAIFN